MAITKIQAGALPAGVVTVDAIADTSITHAKLHTDMDLSAKTVVLPTLSTLDVSGNVTVAGTVDGVDIQTLNTAVIANTAKVTNYNQTKADIEALGIAASSITGALPAISGAALTDVAKLSVGTSAPSTPAVGDQWFDTNVGTNAMKVWSGTEWNQMSNKFSATGGTESTYSSGGINYKAHTFTSSGTFTAESTGTIDVLAVAGGGGGGYQVGGGGGAGGLLYGTISVVAQSYSIIIGSGGGGAPSSGNYGTNGGNTTAFGATAIGGGKGGNHNGAPGNVPGGSFAGGSGGGGGAYGGYNGGDSTGAPATQGNSAGLTGYGNAGGNGRPTNWAGGGGGGAGAVGDNSPSASVGGNGGAGKSYDISGSAAYYAGGGGGSMNNQTSASYFSLGGSGIGGRGFADNGQAITGTTHGDDGAVNTGSGGGGVRDGYNSVSGYSRAGNGSSGIVIVRYVV